MGKAIKVKIDGQETCLYYNDHSAEKGHQYLRRDGCKIRYYFKVRLSELPLGFAFKTGGRLYEMLGIEIT
jgi:hypothetical protein